MEKTKEGIQAVFTKARALAEKEGFCFPDDAVQELIQNYTLELDPIQIAAVLRMAGRLNKSPLRTYLDWRAEMEGRIEEIRRFSKEAQASMAIEGYIISDDESERILQSYLVDSVGAELMSLICDMKNEDQPAHEAIRDFYERRASEKSEE